LNKYIKIIAFVACAALVVMILVNFIKTNSAAEKGIPAPSSEPISPEIIKRDQGLIRTLTESKKPMKGKWIGIRHAIHTDGHRAAITGLFFLDEGKRLISSSWDTTVKIWDVIDPAHPRLIHSYNKIYRAGELTPVLSACKSYNSKLFGIIRPWSVVYDNHKALDVTDLETGFTNFIPLGKSKSYAFSPEGRCIAVGMINGDVHIKRVIYLSTGEFDSDMKIQSEFQNHTRPVTSVVFSKDRFASAAEDRTVRLYKYNYPDIKLLKIIDPSDNVMAMAFSPDSQFLLTASEDCRLCVYDKDGRFKRELATLEVPPRSICFSPDGKILCVSTSSPACFLFSFPEGEPISTFEGHQSPVTAMSCMEKDGKIIFASGNQQNGEILLWDNNGQIISKIEEASSQAYVLGITDDLQIGMGMIPNSRLHQVLDLKTLDFHPLADDSSFRKRTPSAGGFFVERPSSFPNMETEMRADALDIYSPQVKTRIFRTELDGGEHTCFTFTDDYHLAIGGRNGSLAVYTKDGYKILKLLGHKGDILDLACSQNGEWLVSSSTDGTVMLWSLRSLPQPLVRDLQDIDWKILKDIYKKSSFEAIRERLSGPSAGDVNKRALVAYLLSLSRRIPTMKPMVTLFCTKDGRWILWNNRGYFGSKTDDLWNTIGYSAFSNLPEDNPEFISYSQMYDDFFKPDAIRKLVNDWLKNPLFRNTDEVKLYKIEESSIFKDPPPLPRIVSPKEGDTVGTDTVDVEVSIENPYGKIGDIQLYHNGKLVSSENIYKVCREGRLGFYKMYIFDPRVPISYEKFAPSFSPVQKYFKVSLIPGDNVIACQAKNSSNRLFSRMAKVHVNCAMEERPPKLYLLTIGIQNFKNENFNLQSPHHDAQGVARTLEKYRESRFSEFEVFELLDPGKQKIMESLYALKETIRPEDTFIFYASTHGYASPCLDDPDHYEYFLITSDCLDMPTEEDSVSTRQLLEISKFIPALNQVYILDTCHAGAVHGEFAKIYNQKLMVFGMGGGIHILAASSPRGFALDEYQGYGLFTYFFLEALQGLGDADGDHLVTLSEATDYIRNMIQENLEGIQKPEIFCYGPSLTIAER
jgi:WD40 repeat protein